MPVRNAKGRIIGLSAEEVVAELERRTEKAMIAISIEFVANVKEATPVLTGWARANWRVGVGRATPGTVGTRPGASGRKSPGAARATRDTGFAAITRYRINQGRIYVWNNVPYIRRLNRGYSRKAPPGFIEMALEKALARGREVFGNTAIKGTVG